MVRRRRDLKYGAKRRLPSKFDIPCSLFDIPFWFRLVRIVARKIFTLIKSRVTWVTSDEK
jgi:hypothetical protein